MATGGGLTARQSTVTMTTFSTPEASPSLLPGFTPPPPPVWMRFGGQSLYVNVSYLVPMTVDLIVRVFTAANQRRGEGNIWRAREPMNELGGAPGLSRRQQCRRGPLKIYCKCASM
ncbi:unnamed protein product [Arctogadus glacialis]